MMITHAWTIVHNKHVHIRGVVESRQKLRSQEEILSTRLMAGRPHLREVSHHQTLPKAQRTRGLSSS